MFYQLMCKSGKKRPLLEKQYVWQVCRKTFDRDYMKDSTTSSLKTITLVLLANIY